MFAFTHAFAHECGSLKASFCQHWCSWYHYFYMCKYEATGCI